MKRFSTPSAKKQLDAGLRQYMLNIYSYMALGLGLTGAVAFCMYSFGLHRALGPLSFLASFGTIGIAFYMSFALQRISAAKAQMLFWAYSALFGVSLSVIFGMYYAMSILKVFMVTASTFGAASAYGYVTQKDLASWGSFLFAGIIGILIASLINMFMRSSGMDFIISLVSVPLFLGFIAYDTQSLKELYFAIGNEEYRNKIAIFGALMLYTDVVNLFLSLLRLMGDRK